MAAAIGRAVERYGHEDAPPLLVSHGGALRQAVRLATGTQPAPIANGAIWRIDWDGAIVGASPVPASPAA
jgi:broad specificity phosphatase PhoE